MLPNGAAEVFLKYTGCSRFNIKGRAFWWTLFGIIWYYLVLRKMLQLLYFQILNHCTVYSLHFKRYTVRCTLYIVHCILWTVHCILYIVHCTLYTVNCTLYNVHCILYTVHYTLLNIHCTLYTVHCTLYTMILDHYRQDPRAKWSEYNCRAAITRGSSQARPGPIATLTSFPPTHLISTWIKVPAYWGPRSQSSLALGNLVIPNTLVLNIVGKTKYHGRNRPQRSC